MNLREFIKKEFNVNLPIKGGDGLSMESAVIIERQKPFNDYVGIEYAIIDFVSKIKGAIYEIQGQSLFEDNSRMFDKIQVEQKKFEDGVLKSWQETYYYDISECYGHISDY